MVSHGVALHGVAGRCMTLHGIALTAWRCMACHWIELNGVAWCFMALHGMTLDYMVLHLSLIHI